MFKHIRGLFPRIASYSTKINIQEKQKVCAWQVHSYGGFEELQYDPVRIPVIQDPEDVLIQVEASSVNPIDLLMLGGYGKTLLKPLRGCDLELPLTLGRDFCGTILRTGHGVGKAYNVGDTVYGFIPLYKQGTFSEIILANKAHILKKPPHLSPVESASLVYATMTAWSALYLFGTLGLCGANGKRILILGASGGVGTAAVQLLKSQGSIVIGTCSTDAKLLVQSLGADCVFDYNDSCYLQNVGAEGHYDIILDCCQFGFENVPKSWKFGKYISLNSPLLLNTDKYGLFGGLISSAGCLLRHNLKPPSEGKHLVWAFFTPMGGGFQFIDGLIREKKISPLIHKEFQFEKLPDAFQAVSGGHLRGKVVLNYTAK